MVTYPKDWEVQTIGSIFSSITDYVAAGSFADLAKNVTYLSVPSYAQLIRTTDIKSEFKNRGFVYIDQSAYEFLWRVHFDEPKIIMPNIGNCGEVYYVVPEELPSKRCALGPNAIMLSKSKHNLKFLSYLLKREDFQLELKDITSPSGQTKFNKTDLAKIKVTIPSKIAEQKAIAEALSTFDEHIDNLTELIEKKKAIRDGALEDLVTGKVRLEGFYGEWETVEFSRYFRKMKNNTFSRDNLTDNGDIGNIHYGDVLIKFGPVLDDEKVIPRVKPSVSITNPDYLQEKDIVIADTAEDETVGKAVQIGNISIPLVSGLHTIPCRPNFETASGFLGYYINSNAYHSQLLPHITGIKVSSVSKKSIDTTYLHIPKDIKEQKAIASVLTAMDEELDNLKLEKEKIQQMKAGAMDDLLTGKIRLV